MSNFPPAVPPPAVTYGPPVPQPRPANAAAIVSLICGLIGCLLITPIIAIIAGIIGFGKAKRQGGRGMAIAGIILGLIWLVGYAGFGGVLYWGYTQAVNAKQQAITAVNAAVDGDLVKVRAVSSLNDEEAGELSTQLKSYGKCTNLSISGYNADKTNGHAVIHVNGTATFETAGDKHYDATVSQDSSGALKLSGLKVN